MSNVKTQTMPFDLAESFLLAAERELGAYLPKSYRLAMLQENGGEIETDDDDWQQYPVADTSDRKRLSRSANHILKETESCRGWARFPENALAIAGNGAGDRLVLLKQGDGFAPEVYAWLHESEELIKVANDFSLIKAS
jgi:SMI1 / KNR4 family (SUKH-1)